MRFARPSSSPNQPDLVPLSLALMRGRQSHEVFEQALQALDESLPGCSWAILRHIELGRYEAHFRGSPGNDDLCKLARQACGGDPWLAIGRPIAVGGRMDSPEWAVFPEDSSTEPALVLGCWPNRRHGPAIRPGLNWLRLATELIAVASGTAREFEILLEQTSRDPLTGLLNRRGALEALDRELARAVRQRSVVSVLFADLNDFKAINDRHGHLAGDEVLVQVAARLTAALRGSDAIGRFGGDEFLVVLPDTDLTAARCIGRRLIETLRDLPVMTSIGTLRVGLSFGASSLEERSRARELIDTADRRMLEQKSRTAGGPAGPRKTDREQPLSRVMRQ